MTSAPTAPTARAHSPAQRPAIMAVDSKAVLAASGFVMLGYVVVHLGGNLLAFAGSAAFDAYSRSLRELGSPLVGVGVLLTIGRAVLAGALGAPPPAPRRLLRPSPPGGRNRRQPPGEVRARRRTVRRRPRTRSTRCRSCSRPRSPPAP